MPKSDKTPKLFGTNLFLSEFSSFGFYHFREIPDLFRGGNLIFVSTVASWGIQLNGCHEEGRKRGSLSGFPPKKYAFSGFHHFLHNFLLQLVELFQFSAALKIGFLFSGFP